MLASDFNYYSYLQTTMVFGKPYVSVGTVGSPSNYYSSLDAGWNSTYTLYGHADYQMEPRWGSTLDWGYRAPLLTSTTGSPPGTPPPGSGGYPQPTSGLLFPTGIL